MVTLRPEMWEVWSLSVDVVVSLCAPLAVSVLAQGTAFIGRWTLVPAQAFPLKGAMHGFKTAQRCIMELITLSNMMTYVPIVN